MLTQQTLSQLKALKLDGMARAFEEQVSLTPVRACHSKSASASSSTGNSRGATREGSNA